MRQAVILTILSALWALFLSAAGFAVELNWIEHPIVVNGSTNWASVSAVDMDQDGDLDVLAAGTEWQLGDLTWWENDGEQNFTPHIVGPKVSAWRCFGVDMDADGDTDILVPGSYIPDVIDQRITIWANDGNQNFVQHDIFEDWTEWFQVYPADLDSDWDMDIVLIYAAVNYRAGDEPRSVFAVDLDGDGDNDLAVANGGSNNVSILLNNGDGTFQAAVNYGAGNSPMSVFAVDLDGDGDNDLAVANVSSDNVSVLLNNGDGTFPAAVNYGAGDGPWSVFAVDLDGDGDNDLAVANYWSGNVSVLLNNGDGIFQAAVNYRTGDNPASVFAVDLDGDGDNDLAVANAGSDNVSVLLNNGDGIFQAAVNYGAGVGPTSVFAVDLDGDGDNDLAVAGSSGNVSVLLNNGDGTFQAAVNYGAGNSPMSVFAVDLDGDGDNDLAVANYWSGNVSVLLNNGDGTFQAAVNYGAGDEPWSVFAVDLDGDGDNDLAVANAASDNVSVLLNNGDGTFQRGELYWLENEGNLSFVQHRIEVSDAGGWPTADDIDIDGDVDIIGKSDDYSKIYWWENDGSQNFTQHLVVDNWGTSREAYAADVDSDGDNDLLATNGDNGRTSWFENDGQQNFTERNISTSGTPNGVCPTDLDFDGDIDVLGTDQGQHQVRWWENDGQQNFTEHIIKTGFNGAMSPFAADIDEDGDLDVLAGAYWGMDISWWESISMEVRVTLTPHNPPIQIPPQGGRFSYDGVVTNGTNASVTVDAWTMVFLPTGHRLGPKRLFQDIHLAPYGDTSQTISHRVKRWAPPGEYTYVGYVGYYPDTKLDSSYFNFTKLESKDFASGEAFAVFDIFGEELEFELLGAALLGAYPSPFNVQTNITYDLAQAGPVRLEIFDIQGRKVGTLVDAEQSAGRHSVTWDASEFSSGVYFYKLTTGDFTETKSMTLLK